ncbi:MAG: hypothetical protein EOP02_30555 [Proteobacteria bacterium]|nr:MAG: hypothetical protein EOP02_30555 [Pseudomonadota bacterium]
MVNAGRFLILANTELSTNYFLITGSLLAEPIKSVVKWAKLATYIDAVHSPAHCITSQRQIHTGLAQPGYGTLDTSIETEVFE